MPDQLTVLSGYCHCGCGQQTTIQTKNYRARGWVKGEPKQFVHGHNRTKPLPERFWPKVNKNGPNGCWLWTASLTRGYGVFHMGGGASNMAYAHRVAYEWLVGPIPEGLVIDHLCRNPACVNPDHLEPVTNRENILRGEGASARNARKTHCDLGHPLSGDNLVPGARVRKCLTCQLGRETG